MRRALAAVVAAFFALLVLAPSAHAQDGGWQPPSFEEDGSCPSLVDQAVLHWASTDSHLPVTRWAGATQVDYRLGEGFANAEMDKIVSAEIAVRAASLGDASWAWTASVTEIAQRACVTDSIGRQIDMWAATVMRNLAASGVIAGVASVTLVWLIWNRARGRASNGALVRYLAALGVLGMLMTGAAQTTASEYGRGSPGWWMARANGIISTVTSLPAAAFATSGADLLSDQVLDDAAADMLHCSQYAGLLSDEYAERFGDTSWGMAASATPRALDAMWRGVGQLSYISTQFGEGSTGWGTYCYALEYGAGTPPGEVMRVTSELMGPGAPEPNVGSFVFTPQDRQERDAALIFHAACAWTGTRWAVAPGWEGVTNPDAYPRELSVDACADAWTDGEEIEATFFNWKGGGESIHEGADPMTAPEARSYMMALHGESAGVSTATATTYALGSTVVAIAFSMLALTVTVAKVAMVPMGLFVFFSLLWDALPWSGESKTMRLVKLWLGLATLGYGGALILSLVTLISGLLYAAGTSVAAGSVAMILWAAVCPVLAIVMTRMVFTKVLKRPDPFTVEGMTEWADSSGIVPAGVTRGVNRANARAKDYLNPRTGGGMGNPAVREARAVQRLERRGGMQIEDEESERGAYRA